MFILTIDQRGSTGDIDRVPSLLQDVAPLTTSGTFERSVGDEIQGAVQDPGEVVAIALHALRQGHWYVGIGVGPVDTPLPQSPREGSGPAFVAARHAVERAKAAAGHVPLAVLPGMALRSDADGGRVDSRSVDARRAHAASACANAEAVLRLIGRLIQERSEAQWKVVDTLTTVQQNREARHGSQKVVARELGITEQSVSRAVLRSGWQEEWAARPAAEMLLALAHGIITPEGTGGDAWTYSG
ncbi:MarR family transcriptional regulator [Arthrobacter rhizosphaerae]|uniref:MarR family transcriptional regulator n=1 Tax=Arthrobacter rhizosphaerae TaxID=2855490 RepID=UPI001FF1412A|nr:MarR family transcriptional regulator [Arthrobacter rhizosphaerae]